METIYPTQEQHGKLEHSEIQQYFAGTTVFITGATGFIGKVLVEKLLRTCFDIKKLYILIRPKKNKSSQTRFEEYFDNSLFARLKEEQPKSLNKLSIIMGDCELPDLGISDKDMLTIVSEVNCIFHVAATIRFNEKLRTAAYINVRATGYILKIAKKVQNLKSIVHVSTAYSFCPRKTIDEVFYEPPLKAEDLLTVVDAVKEDQLAAMTPLFIKDWPNTYAFTKAIAEDLIKRESADLPIAIVRPSIVMVTQKEPVSGWIDNLYGPIGVFTGISLGVIRTMQYEANSVSDQVPVDYVVNNMLAAAWNTGSKRNIVSNNYLPDVDQNVPIYNYVSGAQNPVTWGQCRTMGKRHIKALPSVHIQWHYFYLRSPSRLMFILLRFFLHTLPGYMADFFLKICGQKPMFVKTYEKIETMLDVLTYFTVGSWTFRDENTQALWRRLGDKDQQLFDFNIAALDWDKFFYNCMYGIRIYLLKDPIDTLPQAKRKAMVLKIVHYSILLAFVCIALKLSLILLNVVINKFIY